MHGGTRFWGNSKFTFSFAGRNLILNPNLFLRFSCKYITYLVFSFLVFSEVLVFTSETTLDAHTKSEYR